MGAAERKPDGSSPTASEMLVTMTQDDLRKMIAGVVRDVLGKSVDAPDYLTIYQVAELMQVHDRTVRNWVTRDGLPALRAGGEYRFRRESVIAWLEARATKPGTHISKHTERAKRMK